MVLLRVACAPGDSSPGASLSSSEPGATILPFERFAAYSTPESEADRQMVNEWIRSSGEFDGVIDFDAIARDPENPARLSAAVDGGDHLHPSAAGYQIMADSIDLKLFAD